MKKLVVLILLLASISANAQVSFIQHANQAGTATSRTVAEPTGTAEDDIVFLFCDIDAQDGDWTDPTDFTEIDQQPSAGAHDVYLGYKIRGSTAGEALTCTYSGTSANIRVISATFRGVDTTTPLDVTYSTGSHHNTTANDDCLTAAQPVTTVTDDSWVLLFQSCEDDADITEGMPSGFTERFSFDALDRIETMASMVDTTAGLVTPGVWTHTDTASTDDSSNFTVVLRESGASPPSSNDFLLVTD